MTTRIQCLDGLRGIAAIAVMEFHFAIFFLPQARLFDIFPGLDRAYLAVDLFFLISGFVMAHVYGQRLALDLRGHWLKFGIARFARLYPLFAVTTLFMMIFAQFHAPLPLISLSGHSLALQPLQLPLVVDQHRSGSLCLFCLLCRTARYRKIPACHRRLLHVRNRCAECQ
jgi:peptidoglycan/LPS O-acetylase OafA/YrhL